jgi:peptidoglycan hydrolase-like protein with peptidoglycan-binding domain
MNLYYKNKILIIVILIFVSITNVKASDISGTISTNNTLSTGLSGTVADSVPTSSGGSGGSNSGSAGGFIGVPTTATTTVTVTPNKIIDMSIPVFSKQLKVGSVGIDVKNLQIYLNTHGYIIAKKGPGSVGNETNTFGSLTKVMLTKFQKDKGIKQTGVLDAETIKVISNTNATSTMAVVNNNVKVNSFTRDMGTGDTGLDVKRLQIYLNSNGYIIANSGAGSKGNETEKFGSATKKAVIKFQKDHDLPATGFFGPKTRKFIETMK